MEAATTRFYKAMSRGDLASFFNLLSEDPSIIEQCIIESSGRLMHSPLHVAASVGNFVMVQTLLYMNPSMCLARDQDGRTPIHVAASKGHVDVIQELHHANCCAALEKTHYDESILHLCVKFSQLEALQNLLELTGDDGDVLLNTKDKNGNTILHLAVATKQPQMVEFLVRRTKIEKNAENKFEMTAVDIHLKQRRKGKGDKSIEKSLIKAKAKTAMDSWNLEAERKWLEDQRSALMVVASLIATMAFQVGINPPGGVWQETNQNEPIKRFRNIKDRTFNMTTTYVVAGTAIWSNFYNDAFVVVQLSNTISLISSLSVILFLISGLPCKRNFLLLLRITLWISITTTALTYLNSIVYLADVPPGFGGETGVLSMSGMLILKGWFAFMVIILLLNVKNFILKVVGWKRRDQFINFKKNLCCSD